MAKGITQSDGLLKFDFFSLLLCMAVGHILIRNPFYGAAVYLLADTIKTLTLVNISRIKHADGNNYISDTVIAVVFIAGMAVAFLYPALMNEPNANFVSLFAICLAVRGYLCATVVNGPAGEEVESSHKSLIYKIVIQAIFCGSAILIIRPFMDGLLFFAIAGTVLLSGIVGLLVPDRKVSTDSSAIKGNYEKFESYKIFSNMTLYATIAVNLGVMLYFFHSLVPGEAGFNPRTYLSMTLWLLMVFAILFVSSVLVDRRWRGIPLSGFILGIIVWAVGTAFIFGSREILGTVLWGIGISLIYASIRKFSYDFEAVGKISGEQRYKEQLRISNAIVSSMAGIFSSVMMLLILVTWAFLLPEIPNEDLPGHFDNVVLQLPIIFMLIAFVFALKQPLDKRNREKLMVYIDTHSNDEKVRDNLKNMFVKKYRTRAWIKVLCTLARPFLRMKVSGIEHLRKDRYPSVFVCNHSFIYGPISAALYLPTYFRPWIHDLMLDREKAHKEMQRNLVFLRKILGKKLSSKIIWWMTKPICAVLNAFNPIPVTRGASRDAMLTLAKSAEALEQGDNILLFPEKPKEMVGMAESSDSAILRGFYTGFAHIGKLYYERTGKELLFYPLYSDRKKHVLKIGEPIAYDPSLDSREAKRVLAEELNRRSAELCNS